MDSKKRSWAKSVVWRLFGIVLLGTITYLITGNFKEMTMVTVLFHGLRMIMYYLHERFWERVSWGRSVHPLSQLPVSKKLEPADLEVIAGKLKELGYIV